MGYHVLSVSVFQNSRVNCFTAFHGDMCKKKSINCTSLLRKLLDAHFFNIILLSRCNGFFMLTLLAVVCTEKWSCEQSRTHRKIERSYFIQNPRCCFRGSEQSSCMVYARARVYVPGNTRGKLGSEWLARFSSGRLVPPALEGMF